MKNKIKKNVNYTDIVILAILFFPAINIAIAAHSLSHEKVIYLLESTSRVINSSINNDEKNKILDEKDKILTDLQNHNKSNREKNEILNNLFLKLARTLIENINEIAIKLDRISPTSEAEIYATLQKEDIPNYEKEEIVISLLSWFTHIKFY